MAAFLDNCRFNPTLGGTTDWTYFSAVAGYQSPAAANVVNGTKYKYFAIDASNNWELGEGAYNTSTGVLARTTILYSTNSNAKVSFAAAPQVAIVALKEDMISVEEANSFTSTQQAQARSNVGGAPFDALAYSGMQINGSVDVSQELLTTGATLASGTAKYIADGIQAQYTNSAAVVTSSQITSASFSFPLPGYSNGHRISASTALTSLANGDCALHRWIFEGYRIARLGLGATGAQPFSYGLQFFAAATGVIFLKFSNSNYSRCYYQEQTVAFGWNWLTGTVPGDTTGTWQIGNSVGMYVEIYVAGKAASPVSPGAWGSTNTTQTTNSTSQLSVNGAATVATGLIVVPGSEVPSAARAPFIMRPFDQEIDLCLRQYQKSYPIATKPGTAVGTGGSTLLMIGNTGNLGQIFVLPERLRALPTLTIYDNVGGANKVSYYNGAWNNGGSVGSVTAFDAAFWINTVITGMTIANFDYAADSRL